MHPTRTRGFDVLVSNIQTTVTFKEVIYMVMYMPLKRLLVVITRTSTLLAYGVEVIEYPLSIHEMH